VNFLPPKDRDIAMVFQTYALYPHKTVAQNMGFALMLRRAPKAEIEARVKRAAEILDLVPYLNRYPRQLSGGQRQRVAIARALARKPRVLILDEATSALDPESEAIFLTQLGRIRAGRTVLIISHRLTTLVQCDRIVVLDQGRIADIGPHQDLVRRCAIYQRLWNQQTKHL
jgi:multiple sugar transport system ATP-binding protein